MLDLCWITFTLLDCIIKKHSEIFVVSPEDDSLKLI